MRPGVGTASSPRSKSCDVGTGRPHPGALREAREQTGPTDELIRKTQETLFVA
jgi:hypothetical protein